MNKKLQIRFPVTYIKWPKLKYVQGIQMICSELPETISCKKFKHNYQVIPYWKLGSSGEASCGDGEIKKDDFDIPMYIHTYISKIFNENVKVI